MVSVITDANAISTRTVGYNLHDITGTSPTVSLNCRADFPFNHAWKFKSLAEDGAPAFATQVETLCKFAYFPCELAWTVNGNFVTIDVRRQMEAHLDVVDASAAQVIASAKAVGRKFKTAHMPLHVEATPHAMTRPNLARVLAVDDNRVVRRRAALVAAHLAWHVR